MSNGASVGFRQKAKPFTVVLGMQDGICVLERVVFAVLQADREDTRHLPMGSISATEA